MLLRAHSDTRLHEGPSATVATTKPERRPAVLGTRRFFDPSKREQDSIPQGHLVSMPANSIAQAHFHPVDEFQVFFSSLGATYQNKFISQVMVSYVDAYTPYGPFTTVENGLEFFTLRAKPSDFTALMPESRNKLIRRPRRSLHTPINTSANREVSGLEELLPLEQDGMAVFLMTAKAGETFQGPSPNHSSGQFHLVLSGSLLWNGRPYPEKSLGWVSPNEPAPQIAAGDKGFRVLIMQLPVDTTAAS